MFSTLVSAWTGTLCSAYLLGISGHRRSFVKSEWAAVRGSLSNLSICVWPQHQLFAPQPDSHSRRLKLISTRCRLLSSCLMYSSAGQGRIKGARALGHRTFWGPTQVWPVWMFVLWQWHNAKLDA